MPFCTKSKQYMHPKRGSNKNKGFKIYFLKPFFYAQDLSKV
jgi:hypothetical protein